MKKRLDNFRTHFYLAIILPLVALLQQFYKFISDAMLNKILLVWLLFLSEWALHATWKAEREAKRAAAAAEASD